MHVVELFNVSRSYGRNDGQVCALKGVDLTVGKGEFLSIWGASGSGKSTLLNIIGLLDRPTAGRVLIGGTDAQAMSDKAASEFRNRTLGFIFQGFNLVPVLSALENVMIPLQIQGIGAHEVERRASEALEQVGLADHRHKRPDEMSGGQRQRVAIARALVGKPQLVLADEPTANLDSVTAESVVMLMKELNQKTGTTFVFSTHDSMLLKYASRNIRLKDGAIVQEWPAAAGENAA